MNVLPGSEGKVTHLRVERRRGNALVFSLARPEDAETTAAQLGLDFGAVGRRYQSASPVLRYPLIDMILFLTGAAGAAWLVFGRPDRSEQSWMIWSAA